jgi:hypothetical protein
MNHIDGRKQFHLSLTTSSWTGSCRPSSVVDNLFNTLLSVRYGSVNNGYYSNQNADEGRTFRAGIRFQM